MTPSLCLLGLSFVEWILRVWIN